ncbi:hypothetical protein OROHE_007426 [Orobanche hederae]
MAGELLGVSHIAGVMVGGRGTIAIGCILQHIWELRCVSKQLRGFHTSGMYCMSRHATDIGIRTDVIKTSEDLTLNLGWGDNEETQPDNVASSI